MPLFAQDIIHKFELGAGRRLLKTTVGVIAEGKGFATDFVRPFSLYLLKRNVSTNSFATQVDKTPDLSNPPAYPLVLAGLLKIMPFAYPDVRKERSFATYAPELWIAGFNQLLVLVCAGLVFVLARRLFDEPVAWISAAVFVATESFWRYSVSGLPVLWLTFLMLLVFVLLARLDTNLRNANASNRSGLALTLILGLLAGVAGLTRYALLLLIVPLVIYLVTLPSPQRVALALLACTGFLALVIPWLVRNYSLSGTLFGTAGYVALEDTPQFPGDSLFRSLSPDFSNVIAGHIGRKVLVNLREVISQIPRLAGSWVPLLFLAGLLVPFRNVVTARLRILLIGMLAILLFAEVAVAPTSKPSADGLNTREYLAIAAPVVFIFAVSLLFSLLDQFSGWAARYTVLAVFFVLAAAPLILRFCAPPASPLAYPPYYPPSIQSKADYLTSNDWMMADIPWAVAWYGNRRSVWLTVTHGAADRNSSDDFYSIHRLKPLRALYLTPQTLKSLDIAAISRWRQTEGLDRDWEAFQARVKAMAAALDPAGQNQPALDPLRELYSLAEKHWVRGTGMDWESFVLGIIVTREVPTGFPLRMAPEGLVPEVFLTDSERQAEKTIKPSKQAQKP